MWVRDSVRGVGGGCKKDLYLPKKIKRVFKKGIRERHITKSGHSDNCNFNIPVDYTIAVAIL